MFSSPEEAGEVVSSGLFPAIVALLIGAANLIYTWWMRSQTVAADKVTKIEARLDKVEDCQITFEERVKHLPTKDDIGQIQVSLERVLGTVGRQESEIASMGRVVNRIDDYLRVKA